MERSNHRPDPLAVVVICPFKYIYEKMENKLFLTSLRSQRISLSQKCVKVQLTFRLFDQS
jgi:hypothetical protein